MGSRAGIAAALTAVGMVATIAAGGVTIVAGAAQAETLRIGFISTFEFPLGREQVNGFRLGLEREGWKENGDRLGEVPVHVAWCDDQRRPERGLLCVEQFLQDKTQIVAGIMWSNVLMAAQHAVRKSDAILVATNAGTSPLAGEQCSQRFIWSSWQNDAWAEAAGRMAVEDGAKRVVVIVPNYQGGRDQVQGFERTYKDGEIVARIMFKLGQTDFQAEFTRIAALRPDAVFIFAPGPMGIAFIRQWGAAGLAKQVKLYSVFMIDNMTLGAMGEAVLGTVHVNHWGHDMDNPANREFVKAYQAAHDRLPSNYAAQTYDAARMIAAAVKETGPEGVKDILALMRVMRKAAYPSVRGQYRYNVNGMPIQSYYRREVVKEGDGLHIRTREAVATDVKDPYWEKCPESERLQ